MDNFWFGCIVGLFIGTNVGVIIAALCASAKQGDKHRISKGDEE